MTDNVEITPGAGANIAADEISGVKYPRSKMVLGNDGINDGDVSDTNPVPMKLVGSEFVSGTDLYEVRVTPSGELAIATIEKYSNIFVHLRYPMVVADQKIIAVDLSDIIDWPHQHFNAIHLSFLNLHIHIDNAGGAEGTIRMGTITRIDNINADISWLSTLHFSRSSTADIAEVINFSPSQLSLEVDGSGNLVKSISGEKDLNDATVNTNITLMSSLDTLVIPGVGDMIIGLDMVTNEADISIEFMYHTEEIT